MLLIITYLYYALFTISIMEILSKNTTPSVSFVSCLGTGPNRITSRILMDKAAGGVPLSIKMKSIFKSGKDHPSYKHGLSYSKIRNVWNCMKQRCMNVNNKRYHFYGGKGIQLCKEWEQFIPFYQWAMANGYKEGLLIDRIKPEGNYEPSNCRWVTYFVNGQNKKLINVKNTSGYRGVCLRPNGKWVSIIVSNRKAYNLGYYKYPKLAAQAYNDFVIAHGTAHPLNIIK